MSQRRGFTLFEILLALSLSAVLMIAVYGAFDLYLKFSQAGTDDMEQAQVARALLKKMATDVRSTIYLKSKRSAGTVPVTDTASSDESDQNGTDPDDGGVDDYNSLARTVDPTEGFLAAMTGLVGDSETLVLHVMRRSRKKHATRAGEPFQSETLWAPDGEQKSVSYFLADSGKAGLAGHVADIHQEQSRDRHEIQGLARLEGDRLAISIAEELPDLDSLAEQTTLLANEVKSLEFRYYDGIEWLETWDSVVGGRLPQAVEINIGIRAASERHRKEESTSDRQPAIELYRLTVALPSAEPYLPEQ